MAAILMKAWQGYKVVFEEWTDPRTRNWPLAAKPYQGFILLGIYLMFVLKWGPRWMRNRRPFNLDKLLIVYNAFQVVTCFYIFVNSVWYAWGWDYKWICEPVDYSNSENAIRIAKFVYYYFLLKLLDLADTVFFVLRKKFNQVSFLHVYHHTGMVILIWGAVTYLPGGHGTLIGAINSFVHVVMYSYYLLTVAYPSLKQSLWWKKYITQLQISVWYAWGWDYKWICEPVDYSNSENAIRIAKFVYYYFLLKLLDLADTVFFVLRKKFNQVSFLHVYHHTGMVILIWGAVTYLPGGHGTLIGAINSFVHVVMYSYYLLTVAYPSLKQSLWWKKYITQLQILQFFWCVVHMGMLVFKPDCAYPRWTAAVFLPQNLFMLILFIDFYIKTYIKKPQTKSVSNGASKERKKI